jgi:hypothetical protein
MITINIKFSYLSLILATSLYSNLALAHPVSFEGGTMVTSTYNEELLDNVANYTFLPATSVGLQQIRVKDEGERRDLLSTNISHRFRRNNLHSQANLYLTLGAGAEIESSEAMLAQFGVQADWESRRLYTLAALDSNVIDGNKDIASYKYRFGFAPYLSNFDEIGTWLIGQVEYLPYKESDEEIVYSNILRFYKNEYMLELGADLDGGVSVSAMILF